MVRSMPSRLLWNAVLFCSSTFDLVQPPRALTAVSRWPLAVSGAVFPHLLGRLLLLSPPQNVTGQSQELIFLDSQILLLLQKTLSLLPTLSPAPQLTKGQLLPSCSSRP